MKDRTAPLESNHRFNDQMSLSPAQTLGLKGTDSHQLFSILVHQLRPRKLRKHRHPPSRRSHRQLPERMLIHCMPSDHKSNSSMGRIEHPPNAIESRVWIRIPKEVTAVVPGQSQFAPGININMIRDPGLLIRDRVANHHPCPAIGS